MAKTKNSIFWTLVGTVLGVTIIGILCSLAIAAVDNGARLDSRGIPCSVSTAQNADGTGECQ